LLSPEPENHIQEPLHCQYRFPSAIKTSSIRHTLFTTLKPVGFWAQSGQIRKIYEVDPLNLWDIRNHDPLEAEPVYIPELTYVEDSDQKLFFSCLKFVTLIAQFKRTRYD
jgi:hypothetical protein